MSASCIRVRFWPPGERNSQMVLPPVLTTAVSPAIGVGVNEGVGVASGVGVDVLVGVAVGDVVAVLSSPATDVVGEVDPSVETVAVMAGAVAVIVPAGGPPNAPVSGVAAVGVDSGEGGAPTDSVGTAAPATSLSPLATGGGVI